MSTTYRFIARLIFGIFKPRNKITGSEFAGVIESVGPKVTKFKVGDKVYGLVLFGANAEYLTASQNKICLMPNCSFEEAATLPFGAGTIYQCINDYKKGKMLINGASGCLGLFAIQIARNNGLEVVGVCSAKNIDLVKKLGAYRVIDYTKVDLFKDEEKFDFILDLVGNMTYQSCNHMLTATGHLIRITPEVSDFFVRPKGQHKQFCPILDDKVSVYQELNKLVDQGKLKSIIGDTFELKDIAKAHELVENGHKIGSTVIKIAK